MKEKDQRQNDFILGGWDLVQGLLNYELHKKVPFSIWRENFCLNCCLIYSLYYLLYFVNSSQLLSFKSEVKSSDRSLEQFDEELGLRYPAMNKAGCPLQLCCRVALFNFSFPCVSFSRWLWRVWECGLPVSYEKIHIRNRISTGNEFREKYEVVLIVFKCSITILSVNEKRLACNRVRTHHWHSI